LVITAGWNKLCSQPSFETQRRNKKRRRYSRGHQRRVADDLEEELYRMDVGDPRPAIQIAKKMGIYDVRTLNNYVEGSDVLGVELRKIGNQYFVWRNPAFMFVHDISRDSIENRDAEIPDPFDHSFDEVSKSLFNSILDKLHT
jgi:hypothetical protein